MKTHLRPLTALFISSFALGLPAPAYAADVIEVQTETYDELNNLSIDVDSGLGFNLKPDGEIRCNYLLNGPIENGDLDRLQKAIPAFDARDINKTPRLCLNSPGGSYSEGLAISQWLMKEMVGTAVPAGAICYSACSLMFMGGTYPWKGELNRFLHVTGDVGFHAPYFTIDSDKPFNSGHISEAYSLGVDGIRQLMALGVGNAVKRFPPELMAEMLAKGPNEVFSIDTVGKAIRFRVHIYGARDNPVIDKDTHCNACVNMGYQALESYGRGGEVDVCDTDAEIEVTPYPDGKRMMSSLAPKGGVCAIDVETKNGKVTSWTWVEYDAKWKDGLELAYWYLQPPNAKLKDLHSGKPDLSLTKANGAPVEIPAPKEQGRDMAAELINFIKLAYLGHGLQDHMLPEIMFADEVDYYDHGRLPRDGVMKDHADYYRKWPSRHYEMIADSLQLKVIDDSTVEASFRYAFQVANTKKKAGGIAVTDLTIQVRDGRFIITREAGKVVSRN